MERGQFSSTIWTQIREAKENEPGSIDRLLRAYRPPVLNYIVNHNFSESDAEDLVQEVFLRILKDDLLSRAEKGKGRFRSLLLGITRNVIGDWLRSRKSLKRGGAAETHSLDAEVGETPFKDLISDKKVTNLFERDWCTNLVSQAMDRLREECTQSGNRYYETLTSHLDDPVSYAELAEKFQVKESDVRNWLYQARQKLRDHLEAMVMQYSSSMEEYEEEWAYLTKYI